MNIVQMENRMKGVPDEALRQMLIQMTTGPWIKLALLSTSLPPVKSKHVKIHGKKPLWGKAVRHPLLQN
jgi:hypothetical protein